MATMDGQFEYSSTGNILKRILNSNKNSDSVKQRSNSYGNNLLDTQSQQFMDQAHDDTIQSVYSTVQHTAGPSAVGRPNVTNDGRFTAVRSTNESHDYRERVVGRNYDINGGVDHTSSSTPRSHSHLDQSNNMDNSGNTNSFQSEFLNISEGIDLDSLTPANLCRLSFVDLANLTIVSLVQLQKYGQIILNLQQDVSVLREEIDSLKSMQNSNKQSSATTVTASPATNSAKESLSNAAENFQKLDAMLEKLPSGKVRDCVECTYVEDSSRKSTFACRVCWRGLHRSPTCVYKHRCLKTLVRDLGLSNDAGDYGNDENNSSYTTTSTEYSGYSNGDLSSQSLYNGVSDVLVDYTADSAMMTCESYPAAPKTIPGAAKRKKSLQSILPLPNKSFKKSHFGNGRVDAIFLHCIKKMDAGSRRECSSCSDRKAGKRQRSRYMCSKCGRGLHSRGTCVTVHSCWVEEFKGWEPGKEFTRIDGVEVKTEMDQDQDFNVSSEMTGEVVDASQEKDSTEGIVVGSALEVAVAVGVDRDGNQMIVEEEAGENQEGEVSDSQNRGEVVSSSIICAISSHQSLNGKQGSETPTDGTVTDQEIRREVQEEFQVEVANVLKVLDEEGNEVVMNEESK